MEPSVYRGPEKIRISYESPHRIFSSKIYPLQAPNGSTIVIYGHEQGMRILWRGGNNFKLGQLQEDRPKINGSSKEDAMLLDSDDDKPTLDGNLDADFEADEETDLCEPYHKIIRYLDVHCGTAVRHIATPHIQTNIRESAPGASPPILSSNIVVVAACNDNTIRLVTLPLLPPPPSGHDAQSYHAVQTLVISGINTHHEVPSSIAITHSAILETPDNQEESSKSRSRSRNPVSADESSSRTSHTPGRLWCFLLVSVSTTAGGLLLMHQIPVIADTELSTSADDLRPIQRCYLGFSCLSSRVLFNPSAFPSDRHSTLLVSAADSGYVKLCQLLPDSRSTLSRGRRSSAATADSATSALGTSSLRNVMSSGLFLATLYAGFIRSSNSSSLPRRKRILDVAWVASGRAIIALLEDGEWGIWDLDCSGSGSEPPNLLRGQSKLSGIQGRTLNNFKLGGCITPTTEVFSKTQKTRKSQLGDLKDNTLAPMTPHTRKVRSDGLFKDRGPSLALERDESPFVWGHICVTEHAPLTASTVSATEESLLVAHGSSVVCIPSLQASWRAETSEGGTFASVGATRPSLLPYLACENARLITVDEIPPCLPTKSKLPLGTTNNESPDILVVADHQLIFFVSPLTEPTPAKASESRINLRIGKAQQPDFEKVTDHALLSQGQLDLEGMDRILDDMGHEIGPTHGQDSARGKSLALDLYDDEDVSMASPTPKAGGRSKRTHEGLTSRNRIGAFN